MRKLAVMIALAVAVTWSLGAPAAWAKTCPKLYKQCQEALKTSNADAATKDKVKKACEEGNALHNDGKHAESVDKLKAALAELEKK
ncbi:MAG: hypothetical protein HY278_02225 [candidate division NC10 bacterium]|nr:hypothetical protein [candidate division NC10 bacterium]